MLWAPSRRALLQGVSVSVIGLSARAAESPPRALEARPIAGGRRLGFDGAAPGPLLRYKQGEKLDLRLVNKTDQPLSLHCHGMRGDNAADGVAPLTQAPVAPGESFDYQRTLTDPGLFCYRPSVFPHSGELMGRGLKGLLLVDEPTPLESDADLLLLLDDPAPAADASIPNSPVAVNGVAAQASYDFPPRARIRLRLANLAEARIMALSFEGVKAQVIAIDSQPCEAFEPVRQTIPVAPGARFELLFDLPSEEGAKARMILRSVDGDDHDLLTITPKGAAVAPRGEIRALPLNPLLPREIKLQHSKKIDLVLARTPGEKPGERRWTINGATTKAYAGDPLFRVKRGASVTLGYDNRSDAPLVMHVHGHAVRLLHDLDDGWEHYWRNAVVAPPQKVKHVAFVADSPGKWALHDDILAHEAAGLATWFEVY